MKLKLSILAALMSFSLSLLAACNGDPLVPQILDNDFLPEIGNGYELIDVNNEATVTIDDSPYIPTRDEIISLCDSIEGDNIRRFLQLVTALTTRKERKTTLRAVLKGVRCARVDGSQEGSLLRKAIIEDAQDVVSVIISSQNNVDLNWKEVEIEQGKEVRRNIMEWLDAKIAKKDGLLEIYQAYKEMIQEEISARERTKKKKKGEKKDV